MATTLLLAAALAATGVFAESVATPLAGAAVPGAEVPPVRAVAEIPAGADFLALNQGDCDPAPGGPVHRVRVLLRRWNPRLDLGDRTSCWDAAMSGSLTLFKAVYGTGQDGSSMDPKTAATFADMEDFGLAEPRRPRAWPEGDILYWAARQLGKPYLLGADGGSQTDCGLLVKSALVAAGVAPPSFTRLADEQYRLAKLERVLAKTSRLLLTLVFRVAPAPGSLVFFRNATSQSSIAYDGVTHVGLWVGSGGLGPNGGYVLQAASRGVTLGPVYVGDAGWVPGFGLVRAKPAR